MINRLSNNDKSFIKLVLIAQGSERARQLAERIIIKERARPKPHVPMNPSHKPYRTEPDYPRR